MLRMLAQYGRHSTRVAAGADTTGRRIVHYQRVAAIGFLRSNLWQHQAYCSNFHIGLAVRSLPHPVRQPAHSLGARAEQLACRIRSYATRVEPPPEHQQRQQQRPESEAGSLDSVYDHPELYEKAFSFRKIESEVAFLRQCCSQHLGREPQAALELGCGPAAHSLELARQGVASVALDCSPAMLSYADRRAQQQGVTGLLTCHGDMQQFDLADFGGQAVPSQVDLAFCLLGTMCHLLDNSSALGMFGSVHRALRPGGLLVLELDHPEHLFGGCLLDAYGPEGRVDVWDVDLPGGSRVIVNWGAETDTFDPVSQVIMRHICIKEVEGGSDEDDDEESDDGAPSSAIVLRETEEVVAQRMWTFQELSLLAQVTGFEVVSGYGDMTGEVELEAEEAFRMVLVLKKVADSKLAQHRWLAPGTHVYTGDEA